MVGSALLCALARTAPLATVRESAGRHDRAYGELVASWLQPTPNDGLSRARVGPPISEEFRRVVREVGLGVPLQDALDHLLERIPSEDLDLLVTAIAINHEVGGNLAQILEIIGETIRERVRIKGEIRVLTAQQSLSGYIISLLPVGLAILIFLLNPSYLLSLLRWPWICMPIGAVICMVLGFMVMRRIVAIEV